MFWDNKNFDSRKGSLLSFETLSVCYLRYPTPKIHSLALYSQHHKQHPLVSHTSTLKGDLLLPAMQLALEQANFLSFLQRFPHPIWAVHLPVDWEALPAHWGPSHRGIHIIVILRSRRIIHRKRIRMLSPHAFSTFFNERLCSSNGDKVFAQDY